jgi:transposase
LIPGAHNFRQPVEVSIMRALDPEVVEAVWETVQPLIPAPSDTHPLGCHRRRIPDRLCFWGILVRLVTGASWVTVEAILERRVSDTTMRARRDQWIGAGVFEQLRQGALAAYDRVIGLDLSHVAVDGSMHKAPCGGQGTGKSPVDRAKLGWKWSVAADANGIPLGWAIGPANRNDCTLLEPTLADMAHNGLLTSIGSLHLDRGYDYPHIRAQLAAAGLTDITIQHRRPRGTPQPEPTMRFGLRWIVESTNSWLSNYGQLRRSTDRKNIHRHAHLCLVTTLIITARLIDRHHQQTPQPAPIR